MNWLNKFMAGRYGSDQLSIALLILAAIITSIGSLTKISLLAYLSYIPLGLCFYRMLSKNETKRRMENYKFSILMSPIYSWSKKKLNIVKDSKTHRYFKCPYCKAQLRLPKGKGKIKISCPVCKKEFVKKT